MEIKGRNIFRLQVEVWLEDVHDGWKIEIGVQVPETAYLGSAALPATD